MSNKSNKEWAEINELLEYFSVSRSTIRRWIERHKNNPLFIKKYKNKYQVNINEFAKIHKSAHEKCSNCSDEHFANTMNSKNNSQDFIKNDNEKLALMTLSKQSNDISQTLLQSKSSVSFWIITGFIVLITLILIAGYCYKQELQSIYSTQLRQLQSTHSTKVIELKEELQETKAAYRSAINRIDILHDEYNDKLENKDKQLNQERERLQQLQQELSQKSQPQSFGTTE